MAQLVFQANSGGQTNVNGQNTASTFNLTLPLTNGNLVSTGDTATVTNTMLANSSLTIGSTSIALGATSTALNGVNIGASTPGTGAFTTFSASSTATFSGGTANGVAYLNGSKVLTTGSALTFDGANLGLGVTPSAWTLMRAEEISGGVTIAGYNATTYLAQNWYYNGGDKYKANGFAVQYSQTNGGAHVWNIAGNNVSGAGAALSFTQAMTLDNSGKLMVNATSNAGSYITVNTLAQTGIDVYRSDSSAQFSGIRFRDTTNANNYGLMGWDSGGLRLDGTAGILYFLTSSTERARIDASGNLGIGTTANASAILDAQSTTKGVRFPNMTTTQKNAISSPAAGLVVFDTTLSKLCVYSGSAWQTITSA